MRKFLIGVVIYFCADLVWGAQELSTFVYPSEDELEEAFHNGEIDFIQLVTLQEIIRFGIDSSKLYLLDEIPNLSYFADGRLFPAIKTDSEQESPFLAKEIGNKLVTGRVSHSYSQRLETDGDSRYRTSGQVSLGENLNMAFRLHKEYSGGERFVYRTLEYRQKKSVIRQVTVGNYSTRLGLGSIVGYRGKILDYADEINSESMAFPDYGGYNGLNLRTKNSSFESELLLSINRDQDHSVRTIAGEFGLSGRRFVPAFIASMTNLKERATDYSIGDFKYGVNIESKYTSGYNRVELSAQAGEEDSFGAALTEGKHLFNQAEINYALWYYDDKYLDITGGSKAAAVRETVNLPEVNFSYSDKRRGQTGGLIKTIVELTESVDLANSLIYANKNEDDYNFEFLSAIEKQFSANWQLRLDHVSRSRHRLQSATETEEISRRSRVEIRYQNPTLYVRTYAAYQSKSGEGDYLSLFANCLYKSRDFGDMSLWLNIGKYQIDDGTLVYWYGFLENRQKLFDNVNTLAKISHSYREGHADEHVSTFSIGLEITL